MFSSISLRLKHLLCRHIWGPLGGPSGWRLVDAIFPLAAPPRRTPCWDRCAHSCELSPLGETQLFGRVCIHTQQSMELHDEVVDGKENENAETTSSRTACLVFLCLPSPTGIFSIVSNLQQDMNMGISAKKGRRSVTNSQMRC